MHAADHEGGSHLGSEKRSADLTRSVAPPVLGSSIYSTKQAILCVEISPSPLPSTMVTLNFSEHWLDDDDCSSRDLKPPANAGENRIRWTIVIAFVLLSCLLPLCTIPRALGNFGPVTRTHKLPRLSRTFEPSSKEKGNRVVVARFKSETPTTIVVDAPAYSPRDLPILSPNLSRLSWQFRSPPFQMAASCSLC